MRLKILYWIWKVKNYQHSQSIRVAGPGIIKVDMNAAAVCTGVTGPDWSDWVNSTSTLCTTAHTPERASVGALNYSSVNASYACKRVYRSIVIFDSFVVYMATKMLATLAVVTCNSAGH